MAVWAFGRLNHLPDVGVMQELANQAMLNSTSFTTKVLTCNAECRCDLGCIVLSPHPDYLSAELSK